MTKVLIAYATREGQTRRIAEHLAGYLRARGAQVSVVELSSQEATVTDHDAVVLAASVHDRQHEPEAVAFARRHALALNARPCLVLSVSSAQMMAESPRSSRLLRRLGALGARQLLRELLAQTQLSTQLAYPVAGALAYTRYSLRQRLTFQLFARLTGLPTDASRDHVSTDYLALERHAEALLARVVSSASGLAGTHEIAKQ